MTITRQKTSILVADDDAALLELMRLTLTKEGYAVQTASSAAAARRLLSIPSFDLVISDIYLGDGSAIDLLEEMQTTNPRARIILITAQGTVETAAAARAAGVFEYLAKPFKIGQLVATVRAALESGDGDVAMIDPGPESMIIGNHPLIVEVFKAVARVAPLDVPVLIRGETGTGKELVARALHRFGSRPDGPFVPINCGAIPENLLESELFGHRKGAFTGADRDHRGAIESARGGTVLLDEIGELPLQLQVKLLRFLQEGEIRPVGARAAVSTDVRVLAATHRDLAREADGGRFREDLYYRLAAYEINLPPVRKRTSDIPLLVEFFRRRASERMGLDSAPGPSDEVLRVFESHPWQGNVRELENLVQRALIDCGGLADRECIEKLLARALRQPQESRRSSVGIGDDLTLEEVERLHIEAVLERCAGNKTKAADILGIERKSLYRKIERLGINPAEPDTSPD